MEIEDLAVLQVPIYVRVCVCVRVRACVCAHVLLQAKAEGKPLPLKPDPPANGTTLHNKVLQTLNRGGGIYAVSPLVMIDVCVASYICDACIRVHSAHAVLSIKLPG